jgi:hypothetical protein
LALHYHLQLLPWITDKKKQKQRRQAGRRLVESLLEDDNNLELLLDSDKDKLDNSKKQIPRKPNKECNHLLFHDKLMNNYFVEGSIYNNKDFAQHFQLDKPVFRQIIEHLTDRYPYFLCRPNCTGKLGLSPEQKITAALRQLAYAVPFNSTEKYCRLGETTARQNLEMFCTGIQEIYGETYLRPPNEANLISILQENHARGFPGCLGSLDCMHWGWKNCPKALAGQFKGKEKGPTIVLEAF